MLSDYLDLVALPLVFRHQFWITALVINILILLDIYSAGYKMLTSKTKRMKSSVKAYFCPLIFKNLVMWSVLLHLSEEVECNWSLFSCHISLRGFPCILWRYQYVLIGTPLVQSLGVIQVRYCLCGWEGVCVGSADGNQFKEHGKQILPYRW